MAIIGKYCFYLQLQSFSWSLSYLGMSLGGEQGLKTFGTVWLINSRLKLNFFAKAAILDPIVGTFFMILFLFVLNPQHTSWKVEERDPRFHIGGSKGRKQEPLDSLKGNVSSNELRSLGWEIIIIIFFIISLRTNEKKYKRAYESQPNELKCPQPIKAIQKGSPI